MTSKEKFYLLKVLVITESKQYKRSCELHNLEKHEHISIQDCVSDIEKDLDRLEKQDKVLEIIKKIGLKRLMNEFDYLVDNEEYDLLKEVFQ